MVENVEKQVVEKLVFEFLLRIDDTTIDNSGLLLAHARCIGGMTLYEEMLFMTKLTNTLSETIQ